MRRIRRLAIPSFLLGAALLTGCGGDSTGPNDAGAGFFIRYRANGTQIEYNDELLIHGVFVSVGNQHTFIAEGVSPDGTITGSSANVSVSDFAPITTRTYAGFQVTQGGGYTSASVLYRTGGFEYSNTEANSDITVTLTEITAAYVRGTFSGTVRASGRPNVSITSGDFYVPRRTQ